MKQFTFSFILTCGIILLSTGCGTSTKTATTTDTDNNNNDIEMLDATPYWVAYRQLKCTTPPWVETVSANTEVKIELDSIRQYYQERHDITLEKISTAQDPNAQTCTECGCQTGTVVQAQVAKEFERDVLLALGFNEALNQPLPSESTSEDLSSEANTATGEYSIDDILKERSETLGENYTPADISSTSETTLNTDEKPVTDVTDPDENNIIHHTGDDGIIEQTAKYLQQMLWIESLENGYYPKELNEIDLTDIDLTGITYIPDEGDQPTDYQLKAEYSDSIDILHPL